MNALATDQTLRIDSYLSEEPLRGVTAGLYIGDDSEIQYPHVMTSREEMRRDPPDILITNYKMLDLLLLREDDVQLWDGAELAYIVVDEFHTYDGAQGTDVAMLLRRLASAVEASRPGRPLGAICPVATSATLGQDGATGVVAAENAAENAFRVGNPMLDVAQKVFGVPFPPESVISEDRLAVSEFVDRVPDYTLPFPSAAQLAATADPARDPAAIDEISRLVVGVSGLTPRQLGAKLKSHALTAAVLEILDDGPADPVEIVERLLTKGAYSWGVTLRDQPQVAAEALARVIALFADAHDPAEDAREGAPFVAIESHLWVRAVQRVLRLVKAEPGFAWDISGPEGSGEGSTDSADPRETEAELSRSPISLQDQGVGRLPAVYCRHCGRAGWAAISPESAPEELVTSPRQIRQASISSDKKRVRALIAATASEAAAMAGISASGSRVTNVLVLDGSGSRLRPVNPAGDFDDDRKPALADGVFVLVDLAGERADLGSAADRCPACATDYGIRYLGAGLATLASASITQLFTGGGLDAEHRKTLMFSDSVQDAAHRADAVVVRRRSIVGRV